MTPTQFAKALGSTRMDPEGKTAQAVRLVLCDGLSDNAAARAVGISPSAVTRARARLVPRERCPHCHGSGYA